MSPVQLPHQASIYEIDTWVWLDDLTRKLGYPVTLDDVPSETWDDIASFGFDAVWLMGVWQRSPAGVRIVNSNASLVASFNEALPGYTAEDVVGSPYCVKSYVVDDHLGGPSALAIAREELARRGMGLLLDYVPNHVAIDHQWTSERPEYFLEPIQGSNFDPQAFVIVNDRPIALGRDPYFPPWVDVVQLNAFSPGVRKEAAATLISISDQCDGVRCDMAMLFMNDVFVSTWGDLAGDMPDDEFWPSVLAATREHHDGFTFIAEAYWDMEWDLIQQGFDYCYDKRLFDRLEHDTPASVRVHLQADLSYQHHLVRFLENHDEPRAATTFGPQRERAAATTLALLPGAKLYHEGQFTGRRIHNPVLLGRRQDEPEDAELLAFYRQLVRWANAHKPNNSWRMCEVAGWPDNQSCQNVLAWCWSSRDDRYLVAVNLSDQPAQGMIRVTWDDVADEAVLLSDVFTADEFKRDGGELLSSGLYVDLAPWQSYVLQLATP